MTSRTVAEVGRSHQTLRPILLNLIITGDFGPLEDTGAPPAWTNANTLVDVVQFSSPGQGLLYDYFDEVSIVSNVITVPGGLWLARFFPLIEKAAAGAETYNLAIANGGGTTIYRETGNLVTGSQNPHRQQQYIETYIDVPEGGGTISFRARGVSTPAAVIAGSATQPLAQLERVAPVGFDKE